MISLRSRVFILRFALCVRVKISKNFKQIFCELKTLTDFQRSIENTWTTWLSCNKDTTYNVQVDPKIIFSTIRPSAIACCRLR
jgi:hypothetical protein